MNSFVLILLAVPAFIAGVAMTVLILDNHPYYGGRRPKNEWRPTYNDWLEANRAEWGTLRDWDKGD